MNQSQPCPPGLLGACVQNCLCSEGGIIGHSESFMEEVTHHLSVRSRKRWFLGYRRSYM
jgi:hypothetical protein